MDGWVQKATMAMMMNINSLPLSLFRFIDKYVYARRRRRRRRRGRRKREIYARGINFATERVRVRERRRGEVGRLHPIPESTSSSLAHH